LKHHPVHLEKVRKPEVSGWQNNPVLAAEFAGPTLPITDIE
jgi:hypothetical protein